MLHCSLCTNATEDGRDIGYRTYLRLLVAVFAWNYGLLVRELLREDNLEALLDAHVAQSLAYNICQRAVERLGNVCDTHLGSIIFGPGTHG